MNCFRNLWTGNFPINVNDIPMNANIRAQIIQRPDDAYKFLHDCMITSYHEKLYAAWYNCPVHEMADKSVIRGRVSSDNGKTWGNVVTMAEDLNGKYIYVPPAFGICPTDDNLYLFATRMTGCDLVHDFEIFTLNEQNNVWNPVRTVHAPFLPNTPVYPLNNGKLITAGRVAKKQDTCPECPAVAISDSGKIDADWRIVTIDNRIKAPDGENWFPETCLIIDGPLIRAFVRHDNRFPAMYESFDFGETWSPIIVHDLPVGSAKIFAGTLRDGRIYLIANLAGHKREKLALFLSKPGEHTFSDVSLLRNGFDEELSAAPEWSYPVAVETDGFLNVVCTSEKKAAAFIRVKL